MCVLFADPWVYPVIIVSRVKSIESVQQQIDKVVGQVVQLGEQILRRVCQARLLPRYFDDTPYRIRSSKIPLEAGL